MHARPSGRPPWRLAYLILALLAGAGAGAQPSFDCAAATSAVERAICADGALAALDRELAARWREASAAARQQAGEAGLTELRASQRRWLAGRERCREQADVGACIATAYRQRIGELAPAAIDQAARKAALETAVRQQLQASGADGEDAPLSWRHGFHDLDGDGIAEAFVLLRSIYWCGNAGCTLWLFRGHADGSFSLMSESSISRAPIRVSSERIGGWASWTVDTRGRGEVLMRFDGRSYPQNPSLQPGADAALLAAAVVVIGAN